MKKPEIHQQFSSGLASLREYEQNSLVYGVLQPYSSTANVLYIFFATMAFLDGFLRALYTTDLFTNVIEAQKAYSRSCCCVLGPAIHTSNGNSMNFLRYQCIDAPARLLLDLGTCSTPNHFPGTVRE